MYRVDYLDEPIRTSILCGSCGHVEWVEGKNQQHTPALAVIYNSGRRRVSRVFRGTVKKKTRGGSYGGQPVELSNNEKRMLSTAFSTHRHLDLG